MEFFGVRLVGFTQVVGHKLLLTASFVAAVVLLRATLFWLLGWIGAAGSLSRLRFLSRQSVNLLAAGVLTLSILSIWFDDPARLATGLGLVSAGLAFALQKVVTSLAGYFVILRGNTFSVGERITMGGVRGDVITLGFLHTTILEMGQPPSVQGAPPAMWVRGRQFTGRIVSVTNDKVFEEPIYNYTRDFPFLWEEMTIPIRYDADLALAERILRESADKHTVRIQDQGHAVRTALEKKYSINMDDTATRVFFRLTDNWLELTVRFLVQEHGIRDVKDAISREILARFDAAGLGLASATWEIVGLPKVRVELQGTGSEAGPRFAS